MDRVRATGARDLDDPRAVEVALRRRRGPARPGLVGVTYVQRVAIDLGVDRDGADSELAAGAHHAHRDLAAVRDQHLPERRDACGQSQYSFCACRTVMAVRFTMSSTVAVR